MICGYYTDVSEVNFCKRPYIFIVCIERQKKKFLKFYKKLLTFWFTGCNISLLPTKRQMRMANWSRG